MPISERQITLKTIAQAILSPSYKTFELFNAVKDYQQLLSSIYPLSDANGINIDKPIILPSGKSLSTKEAARCLIDFKRTAHFIRGLYQGILHCQRQFPNEKIHILYAGTGPFAALALPMTSVFSSESISFTFVEINPESYENLQKTIDFFGISEFVRASILADATQLIPAEETIHILLSETMQQSLRNEPQVAITLHLAPFLHPKGILIPEEVSVSVALIHLGKLQEVFMGKATYLPDEYRLKIADLIHLNRNTPPQFPVVTVPIDTGQMQQFPALHLLTEIRVFGLEVLTFRESQLTIPERLQKSLKAGNYTCTFQYQTGTKPGFHFEVKLPESE